MRMYESGAVVKEKRDGGTDHEKTACDFLSLALLYFLSACGGCGGSSFSADSPERIRFDVRKHVRNRLRAGPGYFERPVCSR